MNSASHLTSIAALAGGRPHWLQRAGGRHTLMLHAPATLQTACQIATLKASCLAPGVSGMQSEHKQG